MEDLERLREELTGAVAGVADTQALEELRVSALGKKGEITGLMKGLGGMAPDERKAMGPALNALKAEVADAIEALLQNESGILLLNDKPHFDKTQLPLHQGL